MNFHCRNFICYLELVKLNQLQLQLSDQATGILMKGGMFIFSYVFLIIFIFTILFFFNFRFGTERSFSGASADRERLSLTSLEVITDALLEIMEACMRDIPDCDWLNSWTSLAKSFAFCFNPALQPRALIVFGCISKSVTDHDMKQLLRILVKALESFNDMVLIEALVMCLTRLQPLLRPESPIHKALFWVATSVLQLDEASLYASGLALLEQNLHTLDSQGVFDERVLVFACRLYFFLVAFSFAVFRKCNDVY